MSGFDTPWRPDGRVEELPSVPVDGYDVPYRLDVLADGREVLVIGEVDQAGDGAIRQGDNEFGFTGTCGLWSCGDVLRQFGVEVSEADVVRYAVAAELCSVVSDSPAVSGGTTIVEMSVILNDYGVPAHVDDAGSLEELAATVEEGRGVIVVVNAGELWNDATHYGSGASNHAVTVKGVARDPSTGALVGFYINDSGARQAGRFVEVDLMHRSWMEPGGWYVETDVVLPRDEAGLDGGQL